MKLKAECPVCRGDGVEINDFGNQVDCDNCNGKGVIPLPESPIDYIYMFIDYEGEGSWHDCANYMGNVLEKAQRLYKKTTD